MLNLQGNRLTDLESIQHHTNLQALIVSQNQLVSTLGIGALLQLNTLGRYSFPSLDFGFFICLYFFFLFVSLNFLS